MALGFNKIRKNKNRYETKILRMNTVETLIDPFDTLTVMFYAVGTTILAESLSFFSGSLELRDFFSRDLVFNLQQRRIQNLEKRHRQRFPKNHEAEADLRFAVAIQKLREKAEHH